MATISNKEILEMAEMQYSWCVYQSQKMKPESELEHYRKKARFWKKIIKKYTK